MTLNDFTYEAFYDAAGNLIDERFTDHARIGPRLMVAADIGLEEAWLGPFSIGSGSWDFYWPGTISNLKVSPGKMRPTEADLAKWIGREP